MVKKLIFSLFAVSVCVFPAHAEPNWTGFSVSAHLGYLSGHTERKLTPEEQLNYPTAVDVHQGANGILFGGEVGYDLQHGNLVVGIAADYSRHTASDRFLETAGLFSGQTFVADLDWTATIRARIGYTIDASTLIYGTGGFAFAGIVDGVTIPTFHPDEVVKGYTVGAGLERAITDNIFAGLEYRYSLYDETFGTRPGSGGILVGNSIEWETHDVRLVVKYKF